MVHLKKVVALTPDERDRTRLFITRDGRNVFATFMLVSSLFLLWGFCNGMIDVMDKHFQEELHLSLSQSAWVQFAHYLGYFLMSLPAGWLATRFSYKNGIVLGLVLVALGGFWFVPATRIAAFWAFLLGVCLIASGLAFLETVANPYSTLLGAEQFAAVRINLAQSCNGVGWILGPIAGATFFYSKDATGHSTGTQLLWIPYAGVAAVVIVLAAIFKLADVPDSLDQSHDPARESETNSGEPTSTSLWARPHFTMGVAAQFLYVAAQAGIFSFLINYLTAETPPIPVAWRNDLDGLVTKLPTWSTGLFSGLFEKTSTDTLSISDKLASYLSSFAFVCFLVGRFTGAGLMRSIPAHRILSSYAVMNVLLCFLVFCKFGWISVACVFLTYFFMSSMFPTIFSLGIFALGTQTKRASAYLVMAIVGGALLPKIMGAVADKYDVSRGFVVPLLCFVFIAYYGYRWPRLSRTTTRSEGKQALNPG
jgi:FHS family L-fucose permease-like MFS transporter